MKSLVYLMLFVCCSISLHSQVMTPELLWQVKRISPIGLSEDGKLVIFNITSYDVKTNKRSTETRAVPVSGGEAELVEDYTRMLADPNRSPDGRYELFTRDKKLNPVFGYDYHPDMEKSNVYIYRDLMYRHWDKWEDGMYSHLFVRELSTGAETDLLGNEPYHVPQEPFGGTADYTWNHDGTAVYYVCKKEYGKEYALSTNTDIYRYDITTGETENLTAENKGYDTHPVIYNARMMAYLQMDEPGYEADKNDIILINNGRKINLTGHWDGTVYGFRFGASGESIYFTAPIQGTKQLFRVNITANLEGPEIEQITDGVFDVTGMVGQSGNTMVVTRTDMNHATELYTVDLSNGRMKQLTHVNDELYNAISLSKIEKRMVATTDGKEMVTWVIYPPNFDSRKQYPAILYCQGGPQGALSQFYSFRWNFQLMAANGYVVVAPNRRGMPGYGVAWNEQISGDYGGQNMLDYMSAIDALRAEPYVDESRIACVGASYGGYSVFFLAGMHEGRFGSFIAHDGIFNTRSMYGTTEELFFVNKDLGGPYWDAAAAKSYGAFNPINHVDKWDAPIMIVQGGKDYRVPLGQALEAFQAAQLHGIKSKLLYFPEENHWVLSPQNGIVWQREFYGWLEETLGEGDD